MENTDSKDQSNIALDLDALAPKTVNINHNGKTIKVFPPSLEAFAKIMDLSDDAKALEQATDLKAAAPIFAKLKDFIQEAIPDLKGEVLNHLQVLALFKLLVSLSEPADDKALAELKKRGITLKTDQGEADPKVSTSPEPSAVS